MAEDGALPSFLSRIHPKYKTPSVAIILVGVINTVLIATGSIDYIASISLISLAICYMIGCLSYIGLRKRYPTLKRPYNAPYGRFGAYFTIFVYTLMIVYADHLALITAGILTIGCLIFYFLYTRHRGGTEITLSKEIGFVEEPNKNEKEKINRQYSVWKWATIAVTIIVLGMYIMPLIF